MKKKFVILIRLVRLREMWGDHKNIRT